MTLEKKKATFYINTNVLKALSAKVREAEKMHGESSRLVELALSQFLGVK